MGLNSANTLTYSLFFTGVNHVYLIKSILEPADWP